LNLWVQGQLGSGISGALLFHYLKPMQTPDFRQSLRQELRAKRGALTPSQQAAASEWLLRQLMKVPQFMRAQHVALYWAMDGEIDLAPVAQQLWKMGKHCYLPVLHPTQERQMWFVEHTPETILTPNRYKIPEPDHRTGRKLAPQLLDVVLLPLVGFDTTGARLGMGGGYYDTTFAFKQQKPKTKPWLLGVAHECQQVEKLQTAEWDIPLHAVVTDKQIFI
jgi:5-formyltetrahydrofolate cyclo-ligase